MIERCNITRRWKPSRDAYGKISAGATKLCIKLNKEELEIEDKNGLSSEWRPSEYAYSTLAEYGVTRNFAEDEVATFVLKWHSRAVKKMPQDWDSRFITETKILWDRRDTSSEIPSDFKEVYFINL